MFDDVTKVAITNVATTEGFDPAELLGIADVESAGVAFWNVNGKDLPAIRFEWGYFKPRLNADQLTAALAAGLNAVQPSSFAGRYDWLAKAQGINPTAALESISMGLGQVMGANWQALGYASVDDLWGKAQTIEGQVDLMVRFIVKNNLKTAIDNEDWKTFAKGYNGSNYAKNGYDTKLAAAVEKYRSGLNGYAADEVTVIQKMLNTVGDYKLTVDGDMGVDTKAAIRDFQLKHGLVVDGVYGPITQSTLQATYLAVVNKRTTSVGVGTTAAATAGAAITETTKQIAAINSTSQILQIICIGLILLGLVITLKATLFNKAS